MPNPHRFTANDVRRILRAANAMPPVSDEAASAAATALNRITATIGASDTPSVTARRDRARHIERAARALLAALDNEGLDALEPAAMRGELSAEAGTHARAVARDLIHAASVSARIWNADSTKGGRPPDKTARALAFHGAIAYHAATLRLPSANADGPALRFVGAIGATLGMEAPAATVSRLIAEMRSEGFWRGQGAKPGA
ncbi:MAG: hypothetical protein NTW56_02210 [Alphaproteobacteria bacterium]|nr:hypothetical protein [Alphaproteobacteria bacterium]